MKLRHFTHGTWYLRLGPWFAECIPADTRWAAGPATLARRGYLVVLAGRRVVFAGRRPEL